MVAFANIGSAGPANAQPTVSTAGWGLTGSNEGLLIHIGADNNDTDPLSDILDDIEIDTGSGLAPLTATQRVGWARLARVVVGASTGVVLAVSTSSAWVGLAQIRYVGGNNVRSMGVLHLTGVRSLRWWESSAQVTGNSTTPTDGGIASTAFANSGIIRLAWNADGNVANFTAQPASCTTAMWTLNQATGSPNIDACGFLPGLAAGSAVAADTWTISAANNWMAVTVEAVDSAAPAPTINVELYRSSIEVTQEDPADPALELYRSSVEAAPEDQGTDAALELYRSSIEVIRVNTPVFVPPFTSDIKASGREWGCHEYVAYLVPRGGGQFLCEVPFTNTLDQMVMNRYLDQTGDATVFVSADTAVECGGCLAVTGTAAEIEPWVHELHIYRAGEPIFVGPLTRMEFTTQGVTLQGRDLTAWYSRRKLRTSRTFTQADLAAIFEQVTVDMLADDPSPNISVSPSLTGVLGDRAWSAGEHLYAADVIAELARTGLDYTAVPTIKDPRRILIGAQTVPVLTTATLNSAVTRDQRLVLDGQATATFVTVVGAGQSGADAPVFGTAPGSLLTPEIGRYGLHDRRSTESKILDVPTATTAAETRYDLLRVAPNDVVVVLLENAPIWQDEVIPGAKMNVYLDSLLRPVRGEFRMKQFNLNVQGELETPTVLMQPVGTELGAA